MRLAFLVFLLGFCLLLFAPKANAQAPAQQDPPPCVPGMYGDVAPYSPRYEYGTLARHFYWFCKKPDGAVTIHGFHCPHAGGCDWAAFGLFLVNLTGLATQPLRQSAAQAQWRDKVAYTCTEAIRAEDSDRGRVCLERFTILQANLATWLAGYVPPAAPVWKVKPNGTYPDRPVSVLSALGGLTTLSGVRVLVGTLCDMTRPWKTSGANTYGSIDPAHPERVAVCIRT